MCAKSGNIISLMERSRPISLLLKCYVIRHNSIHCSFSVIPASYTPIGLVRTQRSTSMQQPQQKHVLMTQTCAVHNIQYFRSKWRSMHKSNTLCVLTTSMVLTNVNWEFGASRSSSPPRYAPSNASIYSIASQPEPIILQNKSIWVCVPVLTVLWSKCEADDFHNTRRQMLHQWLHKLIAYSVKCGINAYRPMLIVQRDRRWSLYTTHALLYIQLSVARCFAAVQPWSP